MRKLNHGPAAPKIARPSIHPNPSSRFRRTSIAPPTDDSQITQHRIPTLKSDRLLASRNAKSLPIFKQFTRDHPARCDDVCSVPAVAAAGRGSAVSNRPHETVRPQGPTPGIGQYCTLIDTCRRKAGRDAIYSIDTTAAEQSALLIVAMATPSDMPPKPFLARYLMVNVCLPVSLTGEIHVPMCSKLSGSRIRFST